MSDLDPPSNQKTLSNHPEANDNLPVCPKTASADIPDDWINVPSEESHPSTSSTSNAGEPSDLTESDSIIRRGKKRVLNSKTSTEKRVSTAAIESSSYWSCVA